MRDKIIKILEQYEHPIGDHWLHGVAVEDSFYDDVAEDIEKLIPRWIPADERLPENTDIVIATIDSVKNTVAAYYDVNIKSWWICEHNKSSFIVINSIASHIHGSITHWQPLPAPPEEA